MTSLKAYATRAAASLPSTHFQAWSTWQPPGGQRSDRPENGCQRGRPKRMSCGRAARQRRRARPAEPTATGLGARYVRRTRRFGRTGTDVSLRPRRLSLPITPISAKCRKYRVSDASRLVVLVEHRDTKGGNDQGRCHCCREVEVRFRNFEVFVTTPEGRAEHGVLGQQETSRWVSDRRDLLQARNRIVWAGPGPRRLSHRGPPLVGCSELAQNREVCTTRNRAGV